MPVEELFALSEVKTAQSLLNRLVNTSTLTLPALIRSTAFQACSMRGRTHPELSGKRARDLSQVETQNLERVSRERNMLSGKASSFCDEGDHVSFSWLYAAGSRPA